MKTKLALLCTALMSALASGALASSIRLESGIADPAAPVKRAPLLPSIASAVAGTPDSAWQCDLSEDTKVHFAIHFHPDGNFYVSRQEGADLFPGQWTTSNGNLTWTDGAGRLYSVQQKGDRLSGKTSTLDLRQSRGRVYNGSIECTRNVGAQLAKQGAL